MNSLISRVTAIARSHVAVELQDTLLDPDVSLSSIGIDSLGLVAFLLDVEDDFGIRFPAERIDLATFHSVRTVTEAVKHMRGGRLP
jgi:acyl carrier protein